MFFKPSIDMIKSDVIREGVYVTYEVSSRIGVVIVIDVVSFVSQE